MTIYGLQFDSIQPLPFTPNLQAHYVNGAISAWTHGVSYGPGRVWIDTTGTDPEAAFWRDIEPGDGGPASVPSWLDARYSKGMGWGGIYCDRDQLNAVLDAAAGRPMSLWLAALDGSIAAPALPGHVTLTAIQACPQRMVGGITAYVSVVVDEMYWKARAL